MVELVKSYNDFFIKLNEYRPDITECKSTLNIIKSRFCFPVDNIYPTKSVIDIIDIDDNSSSSIMYWGLPEMFGKKKLVDFGNNFQGDINTACIDQQTYRGNHFSFRLNLTNEAMEFVSKYMDENIPIKKLEYMSEYELASVGKFGASLIKNKKECYVLTPLGPINVSHLAKDTNMFSPFIKDFMNVRVEKLLNIELNNCWNNEKILQLTKDTMLGFGNRER